MTPFDLTVIGSVASICIWSLTFFASKKEIMRIELRVDRIEAEQIKILQKLSEISTKIDILLGKK